MTIKPIIKLVFVLILAIFLYGCGDDGDVTIRVVTQLNTSRFAFETGNLSITLADSLKTISPNLNLPSGSKVKILFGSPIPQARESKVKGFWSKTNARASIWPDTFNVCTDLNENDICDFFENFDFNEERCKNVGYAWLDEDEIFDTFYDNCCGDDPEEFGITGPDASIACCTSQDSCVFQGKCFNSGQCNSQGQFCKNNEFKKTDGNFDQVDDRCTNFVTCNLQPNMAEPCTDEWQCTQWSNCTNIRGTRTRQCMDINNCGTNYNKPDPFETQSCLQLMDCVDTDQDGYGRNCFSSANSTITYLENDCNDNNPNINPTSAEICDGQDNNCDGLTDDGCPCIHGQTRFCGFQNGECTRGIQFCSRGLWSLCFANNNPTIETCNDGLDNDCDGMTDEGCPCDSNTTIECGKNIGICKKGTQRCVDSQLTVCEGSIEGSPEICNDGLDNDCDSKVDVFDENCNQNLLSGGDKTNTCTNKICDKEESCTQNKNLPVDCGGPCPKCPGDETVARPVHAAKREVKESQIINEPVEEQEDQKTERNPLIITIAAIVLAVLILLGILVAFKKIIKAKLDIKTQETESLKKGLSQKTKLFRPITPILRKGKDKIEKELEKSFKEAEKTLGSKKD